jgi:hypothetical protein
MPTPSVEYRCVCGHFESEHEAEGCAGCDSGGCTAICDAYVPDPEWPEPSE